MRSMGAWFGRLAMAGACLTWVGCGGGGDVPDPDSDSRAATNEPTKPVRRPAPDAAEKPEPEALASNTTPTTEAPKSEPTDKPAEAEKPAPSAPKVDSSGTDEMLKIPSAPGANATGPAPPSAAANTGAGLFPGPASAPGEMTSPGPRPGGPVAAGTASMGPIGPATAGVGPSAPAAGGSGPIGPASAGVGASPAAPDAVGATPQPGSGGGVMGPKRFKNAGGPGGPAAPGAPGAPVGPDGTGEAPAGGPGRFASPGGGPGFGGLAGPGGEGAPGGPGVKGGGPGGTGQPANFNFPNTAVTAFLDALKAKDKDKLAEATARRAPTEAVEKHRKIFSEIIDGSISDDELDEIAKSLDGFRVMGVLDAKSSARIGVVVGKPTTGGGHLQRTIETRKEKDGSDVVWKVVDIAELYNFKAQMQFNRGRSRAKGR